MYICICNGVTDSTIRSLAEDGVKTMRELRMATGCANGCGRCAQHALEILKEHRQSITQLPLQIVGSPA